MVNGKEELVKKKKKKSGRENKLTSPEKGMYDWMKSAEVLLVCLIELEGLTSFEGK